MLLIFLLVLDFAVLLVTLVILEHQDAAVGRAHLRLELDLSSSFRDDGAVFGARKAEQKKKRKQMQERWCFSLSLCRLCLVASQHGTEYGENIFAAANKGRPFVLFSV